MTKDRAMRIFHQGEKAQEKLTDVEYRDYMKALRQINGDNCEDDD